jgi:hypothetical protein
VGYHIYPVSHGQSQILLTIDEITYTFLRLQSACGSCSSFFSQPFAGNTALNCAHNLELIHTAHSMSFHKSATA